jgi:hypothetical protein
VISSLQLLSRIAAAFPLIPVPVAERIVANVPGDLERDEVRKALAGKTWTELPVELLRYHSESLYLLLPEGWIYYAPAFMSATISDYMGSDMISRIFVTSLHLESDELFPLLTTSQKAAVREFLEWLLVTENDHPRREYVENILREL